MISYLIEITQFVRIKSLSVDQRTKSENANAMKSCLGRLGEMKVILEKMRPMERKMRYQIDKILAIAASSGAFANVHETKAEEEEGEEVDALVESDPLAFRPNPESLMGKDDSDDDNDSEGDDDSDDGSDSEVDDEDDEELRAAKATLKLSRSKARGKNEYDSDNDTQIYQAPRITATPFVEKEKASKKEERILKRQQNRMQKSELLSTLKSTYGDAPDEDDFGGGATIGSQRETAKRFAERETEKINFEEDAFIRLTTSRKEKKLKNKIMRDETSNLNSIADLGNLTAGVSMAFGEDKKGDDDFDIKVGGHAPSRHVNGKRRREGKSDQKRRSAAPKNSFQKALYGVDGGGGGGKQKKSKR